MALSKELIRFSVVGLTNTIIGFSIFILSLKLLPPMAIKAALAQAICYIPALLWSYYWNSRWTFKGTVMNRQTLARFVFVQLSLLALSTILIGLGVDFAMLPATPVWFIVMAFIIILNFLATKLFVFQRAGKTKANE